MAEFLTRDILFAPAPRRVREVALPDGRKTYVRSLTENEWATYSVATLSDTGKLRRDRLADSTRRLVVLCLCDEHGNPILRPTDLAQVATVDSAIIQAIYNAARDHIGVSDNDIESLVKNSDAIPGEG